MGLYKYIYGLKQAYCIVLIAAKHPLRYSVSVNYKIIAFSAVFSSEVVRLKHKFFNSTAIFIDLVLNSYFLVTNNGRLQATPVFSKQKKSKPRLCRNEKTSDRISFSLISPLNFNFKLGFHPESHFRYVLNSTHYQLTSLNTSSFLLRHCIYQAH